MKVTYRKATAGLPKGWHKGAPPHVGLWKASETTNVSQWRWWDGKSWSVWCSSTDSKRTVREDLGRASLFHNHDIKYRYDWPTNARVARINPETGECTGSGPCPYETAAL